MSFGDVMKFRAKFVSNKGTSGYQAEFSLVLWYRADLRILDTT